MMGTSTPGGRPRRGRARRGRLPRALLAMLVLCELVGGAILFACSSSPPVQSTVDGVTDASSTDAPKTDGAQQQSAPDGDQSKGEDGRTEDATGSNMDASKETPDVGYSLVDVASLPDVAGLDAYSPCAFLTCSGGCCPSDGGACVMPGTADTTCGSEANACVDCTLTSQTCNPQSWQCQ